MNKRGSPSDRSRSAAGSVTLGRELFAEISAVEGIVLTKAMTARVKQFDRKGMSPEQRRRAIIGAYRKG
jgi:hypothetical protein